MKESRGFGYLLALLFSVLAASANASSPLKVGEIEVIEDRYAEKVISATLHYDGSLGETAFLGVVAITEEAVRQTGYSPTTLRSGTNEVLVGVQRPAVEGDVTFESHSLRFEVYGRAGDTTRREKAEYALNWKSMGEYFEFGDLPLSSSPYETITSIAIDEALGDIGPLVRDAHAGGIESAGITIFYSATPQTAWGSGSGFDAQAALSVPETTSLADLKRLAGSLSATGVERIEFRPIPIDAPGFELGQPMVSDPSVIHGLELKLSELESLADDADQAALYARAGFDDFDRKQGYDRLLEKAIALNVRRKRTSSLEARKIAEYLIAAGYENSRVYSVLAASHYGTHKSNEDYLRAVQPIYDLGLAINPEDQWLHAQYSANQAMRGDYESAEHHAKLAIKYAKEQNVWNINNYGRIYAMQGRNEEAKEKYDALRGLKNLNPANQRAHRIGLAEYADVLIALDDPLADEVYEELITTYPEQTACERLEYAAYLAAKEASTQRSQRLLADRNVQNCQGYASVAAFVDVLNWYREQRPDLALRKALMRHEDMGMLLYSVASVEDGTKILTALAERGIDLGTESANGFNTLQMAVLASNPAVMNAALEAGIDIDSMSQSGFTALMLAVYVENEAMIRELLVRGARVDVQSTQGFTVLDMVAASTNDDIKVLFQRAST